MIRFRDLPIRQKLLAAVAIFVSPLQRVVTDPSNSSLDLLRELQGANDRAESASRARREFLAGMSHEMRTPLHAILSFAELGGQKAATLTPEKAARYFKIIEESGRRLLDLLGDLVDLANLEAGKGVLRFASVPVESVVQGVVDELRPLFLSRGVGLEATCEATSGWIVHGVVDEVRPLFLSRGVELEATSCAATSGWIDREALTQVLRCILTNAARSSSQGSAVTVALARSERGSLLSVTRPGSGVAPARQSPAVPELRHSGGSKTKDRRSALIFAICGEVMTAHGGRIWADYRDDSGETVYLEIPDRSSLHGEGASRTA